MKRALFFLFSLYFLATVYVGYFSPSASVIRQDPYLVKTVCGNVEVREPIFIELFSSPTMQRLKYIRQYGVADYVLKQPFEYTRYTHSLGVWALLKKFGACMEEQIAGALHDASHTVFSHCGEHFFNHKSEENSYQDDIHEWSLKQQGVDVLLQKYGYSLASVLHKSGDHRMLEQPAPDLCADRIEYNLQGGLLTHLLSEKEVETIIQDLRYHNGRWFLVTIESAKKLGLASLYNTEHTWGHPEGAIIYDWTAQAMRRAVDIGLLTVDDVHFSTDDRVWGLLWVSNDAEIKLLLKKIINYDQYFSRITHKSEGSRTITTKFRGLDPWIKTEDGYKRLTELDVDYKNEYDRVKIQVKEGWEVYEKS